MTFLGQHGLAFDDLANAVTGQDIQYNLVMLLGVPGPMDLDTALDLSQDYRAIRWMQENVEGSPVIVEANQVEYHWASRYTVYTGLPGVVGWNWHQRQQRTITPQEWVFSRVEAVNLFYDDPDLDLARNFLEEYRVSYIILGELERARYSTAGIEKFSQAEGSLWEPVYQDGDTIIYRSLVAPTEISE